MKNKICKILDGEYFWVFFALIGVIIQVISYVVTQDSFLSFISGFAGVVSVVLCSEKKLSFYFWSFLQLFTFVAICLQEQLYGKIIENIFYFITMVGGIIIWNKNKREEKVIPKKLSKDAFILLLFAVFLGVIIFTIILGNTNDTHPFMDSLTTVPAIIAQILMITRYREQWIFWMAVDIASIVLWVVLGNYYMVIQYVFWTLNCFYGYYKWR